ncbi:MAG TPA: hypothetical protein VG013_15900, partial [Gemmataceae bacterium]|nr:hypothetical protein [Gemmataceae bacterium]
MRHMRQLWNNRFLWLVAGALVAALGQTRAASDDQPSSARVDELRRTLRDTVPEEDPDRPKESEKLVQA